ncbi:hypothetical protein B0O99DRAFT_601068 [Bisporella sp. PMI_857]|nr:hypothetical protein B0O99DRAFT_601068 [Bisporella sp. PMI_857]
MASNNDTIYDERLLAPQLSASALIKKRFLIVVLISQIQKSQVIFFGEGGYSLRSHQEPVPGRNQESPGLLVAIEQASMAVGYPLKAPNQGVPVLASIKDQDQPTYSKKREPRRITK